MANKQLKVDVIVNAKTKELNKMFKKLNRIQTQVNQQSSAQNRVTKAVNKTNAAYKKSTSLVHGLTKALRHLAGGYLMVQAAKAAITSSDTITSAENKLNHLNATALGSAGYTTDTSGAEVYSQATLDATQTTMDKMYTSAQKVRMGYADMMSNVSKSMTLAGDSFGGSIDNAIRFQEIMAEAYALSGSSAAEMSSSMYQMIQGLGSGVLQGDELRSVREGASMAYKAIEEFAQGIYGADKNLKDLAADGLITSDIVVKAILSNGEKMDASFAKTSMTFAQAWTNIKNTALKSFEPILQKLNELLNSPIGQSILNGIGKAIQIVAGAIGIVIDAISWLWGIFAKVFTFIKTNWAIISKVILTAITVIAVIMAVVLIPKFIAWLGYIGFVIAYYAVLAAQAIASGLAAFVAWTMAHIPLLILIVIIIAVIVAVIWMSDSFADACGMIVGAVFWLGATIWNIIVGLTNGIIQFLWTRFVEPWIGIIEWILNVCQGGFDSFGGAVANLIGNIISWFLSLGKVVTKIIDAIFGTNWTDGLNALQDKVVAWGKNENAITLSREAPEVLQRISAQDAYSKGYDVGYGFGEGVGDKLNGLKDKLSVGGLPNESINANLDNIAGNTGGINDNTGKMAKSMELTAEDLEYLRKVANMEWKKEFTTANITVDMTNNNNVSNDFDLKSLATSLRDLVEEEMFVAANGTYV